MYMTTNIHDWIKETNLKEKHMTVHDYIEAGITSIYRLPDIMINKPFKDTMKKTYGKYRNEIVHSFATGEIIKISCRKLIDLILEAYTQMNEENMINMHIQ